MTTAKPKPANSESRSHPRLYVSPASPPISIKKGYQEYPLLNISLSGISFLVKRKYIPGQVLQVNLGQLVKINVEVVHVKMVMLEGVFMEAAYQVGCRFTEGELSQQFYQEILSAMDHEEPSP